MDREIGRRRRGKERGVGYDVKWGGGGVKSIYNTQHS